MSAQTKLMKLGVESRVLQFAPYTFDASLDEIWCPLTTGGCVCVPAETARIGDIVDVINQMEVNWTFFTPSYLRLIKPEDVPTLRTLLIAGEAASRDTIDVWYGKVKFFQEYGPTETAIACMGHEIPYRAINPANIGRSLGSNSWIVEPENDERLVPIGAVGELLVSGPILATGYLGDPQKTSKAFKECPTWLSKIFPGSRKYKRFYKTGDVGA
jgi:non-ribosomal peptide synthetase component F